MAHRLPLVIRTVRNLLENDRKNEPLACLESKRGKVLSTNPTGTY